MVRHNRHVSRPGRAIFNRTGMYIYLVLKQSMDHHYLIILTILGYPYALKELPYNNPG